MGKNLDDKWIGTILLDRQMLNDLEMKWEAGIAEKWQII